MESHLYSNPRVFFKRIRSEILETYHCYYLSLFFTIHNDAIVVYIIITYIIHYYGCVPQKSCPSIRTNKYFRETYSLMQRWVLINLGDAQTIRYTFNILICSEIIGRYGTYTVEYTTIIFYIIYTRELWALILGTSLYFIILYCIPECINTIKSIIYCEDPRPISERTLHVYI